MVVFDEPPAELDGKEARLRGLVRSYEACIVAFSGGVDSALVATVATQELGSSALVITGVSASLAKRELRGAVAFAERIGARHELLHTDEVENERYRANAGNRCYFCKSELYGRIVELARARGFTTIADGLNVDDLGEIRPGRRAAGENGVRSPLADVGFTKADVRTLAKKLQLDVWDKPALACLSSRFPTGTAITGDLLERVERAEDVLYDAGLAECRVRHHGDLARIEVPIELADAIIQNRTTILAAIRATGYRFVTLDLAGYVRGAVAGPVAGSSLIDLIALA